MVLLRQSLCKQNQYTVVKSTVEMLHTAAARPTLAFPPESSSSGDPLETLPRFILFPLGPLPFFRPLSSFRYVNVPCNAQTSHGTDIQFSQQALTRAEIRRSLMLGLDLETCVHAGTWTQMISQTKCYKIQINLNVSYTQYGL